MQFRASAPGSLMLLGEYAVLYGKQALVCAIDKRITLTLTPRSDDLVKINSASHGHYTTNISNLKIEKPFQFVLGALKQYQTLLRRGCDIEVESSFSDQVGFGSSAAVTTATLAALFTWLTNTSYTQKYEQLLRQGRHVVRQVQGAGSGADIAASVYGGIVGYQTQPLCAEKFTAIHPLTAVYSGFKTPTADAIKIVQARFVSHPHLFRALTTSIGQCALEGLHWMRKGDWSKLGNVMDVQQGLMEALGVSTPLLRGMVDELREQTGMLGAKISGAGLGDCVIGLGEAPGNDARHIPVTMTLQGVVCEKI